MPPASLTGSQYIPGGMEECIYVGACLAPTSLVVLVRMAVLMIIEKITTSASTGI